MIPHTAFRAVRVVSCGIVACAAIASIGSEALAAEAKPRDVVAELRELRQVPVGKFFGPAAAFIESLNPDEIAAIRPLILDQPAASRNRQLVDLLIQKWGEHDAESALSYATAVRSTDRPQIETLALLGWARKRPREAWTRLMVISNRGADSRYSVDWLLDNIAIADLSLALELYQDMVTDRRRLLLGAEILADQAIADGKQSVIAAEIQRMAGGPSRNALRDAYWREMGRYAVKQALKDVEALTNMTDSRAARMQIAVGWATRDFSAAVDHVLATFDAKTVNDVFVALLQAWASGATPEDASAAIKKLPDVLSEQSLLGAAPILARVDPVATLDWAATLSNVAIRRRCISAGMWCFAATDPEAAHAYLKKYSDLNIRVFLLRSYLLARIEGDTFVMSDLDELNADYHPDLVAATLYDVSLAIANPAQNRMRNIDVNAYIAWVRSNKKLNDEQRERALRALSTEKR